MCNCHNYKSKKTFKKSCKGTTKIGNETGIFLEIVIGVSIIIFFFTPEIGWLEYCEIDKYILNYIKRGLKCKLVFVHC